MMSKLSLPFVASFGALALALPTPALHAQEATEAEIDEYFLSIEESLERQGGQVSIAGNLATIDTPAGMDFLGPQDAQMLLEDLWGNPADDTVLGMIVPSGVRPSADESWGIVISYEEDGHVDDSDAAEIDFGDLLQEMKGDAADYNGERVAAGYPAIQIIGWARPPHYDAAAHKLHWAKVLHFGDEPANTLNDNIRILGRKGVLVLNAVAAMEQESEMAAVVPQVSAAVQFTPGNRYEDYDPSTDKLAAYGIGALVTGKLAAKAGLFKLLFIGLLKAKKLLILVAVGGGVLAKRMLGRSA